MIIDSKWRKLYAAYCSDGHTLEATITWLKDTTKADDELVDFVITETMQQLASGYDFHGTCDHCGRTEINAKIDHYMMGRVFHLKKSLNKQRTDFLEDLENKKLEARLTQLSKFNKEREKLIHGTFFENLFDWKLSRLYCWYKKLDRKKLLEERKQERLKKYGS